MPAINKLISHWRKWINRNKTFTTHEMDELENHLLEEIDDLKEHDHMSEEEAFQKVVSVMGGREALDKEFVKTKPMRVKVCHWIKNHSLEIYSTLLLLIVFLLSDLIYSSTHFVDVYEPVSKNYEYQSSENNSYEFMIPISKIKPATRISLKVKEPSDDKSIILNNEITVVSHPPKANSSLESRITFNLKSNEISPDGTITIVFPENTIDPNSSFNFDVKDIWETKTLNKMITKPSLYSEANIFFGNYQFVLDDKNQLWIEQSSQFTINSSKILLKSQNLSKNRFILDKSILYDKIQVPESFFQPYIKYPPSTDDPKLIFIKSVNPNQFLLFQKESDRVRTIRLQLFQLPNQKHPILVWDEVKLVRKPIHLWNFLFHQFSNNK